MAQLCKSATELYQFVAFLGCTVEIEDGRTLKVYPETVKMKQDIFYRTKDINAKYQSEPVSVIYELSEMEVFSDEKRKKDIAEMGEIAKKFGGFLEVSSGREVDIKVRTEKQMLAVKSLTTKYFDRFYYLNDDESKKVQLFIKVSKLYANDEGLTISDKNAVLANIIEVASWFKAEAELVSKHEVVVHAPDVDSLAKVKQRVAKYNGLKIETDNDTKLALEITYVLKEGE